MNPLTQSDFVERLKNGEFCVAMQYSADRKTSLKVGDPYIFNYINYKVKEICTGDLDGYCWIGKE